MTITASIPITFRTTNNSPSLNGNDKRSPGFYRRGFFIPARRLAFSLRDLRLCAANARATMPRLFCLTCFFRRPFQPGYCHVA